MAVKQKIHIDRTEDNELILPHYSNYNRMICNYMPLENNNEPDDLIHWGGGEIKQAANTVKGIACLHPHVHAGIAYRFMPKRARSASLYLTQALTKAGWQPQHLFANEDHLVQVMDTRKSAGEILWIDQTGLPQISYLELAGHLNTSSHVAEVLQSDLDNLIEKAQLLKQLPFDWDEERAISIEDTTVDYACWFLKHYYNYTLKHLGIKIQLPEINPCPDGSIDLEWHTPDAQLLINIRKDKEGTYTAYYYGDRHNNKMQVKGSTPFSEFSEHLAVWMKYLA
jgi:hypothetical protein